MVLSLYASPDDNTEAPEEDYDMIKNFKIDFRETTLFAQEMN